MKIQLTKRRGGFTLVEIMIVVAIIALLAAIAVPNFMRSRKRAQGTRMKEDLRIIDHAVEQYAIDHSTPSGTHLVWTDVQPYLKPGTVLYNSAGADLFGNFYWGVQEAVFAVDVVPEIRYTTYVALSDVCDAAFWDPYHIPGLP